MSKRTVRLTKDGHDYVFAYGPGYEGQVVDEIMQLAADDETDFDWMDAAALGFQVAQYAAIDCCTEIMSPAQVAHPAQDTSAVERSADDSDDAKDGPCTNHNLP